MALSQKVSSLGSRAPYGSCYYWEVCFPERFQTESDRRSVEMVILLVGPGRKALGRKAWNQSMLGCE